jgi:hypothetical protein
MTLPTCLSIVEVLKGARRGGLPHNLSGLVPRHCPVVPPLRSQELTSEEPVRDGGGGHPRAPATPVGDPRETGRSWSGARSQRSAREAAMVTIGVDAHQQVPAAVALDDAGEALGHWRGPNSREGWTALQAWAVGLGAPRQWELRGPGTMGGPGAVPRGRR